MSRSAAVRAIGAMVAPGAGPLRGTPDCGWPGVLEIAAQHGLLPTLGAAARGGGVTVAGPERAPLAILEDTYRANARRVADLAAQGREVLGAFAAAGIDAVPLKGWHGLLVHRWPDPAARYMVDLDVLVPEADVARAATVLAGLGYEDLGVEDPEGIAGHEVPARGRSGRAGSVEVHRAVLVPRRAALLPAAEVIRRAEPVDTGCAVRVPCATHAMTIVVGHAQLQDDGARLLRVPLRAIVEAAVMMGGPEGPQIDWEEVAHRFRRVGSAVPLAGFAVGLEDLFGVRVPVPRRGGGAWWRAALEAFDHPRAAVLWSEVASLPRTLSSERMARRYGAHTWTARQGARARHVVKGSWKRVRRG